MKVTGKREIKAMANLNNNNQEETEI